MQLGWCRIYWRLTALVTTNYAKCKGSVISERRILRFGALVVGFVMSKSTIDLDEFLPNGSNHEVVCVINFYTKFSQFSVPTNNLNCVQLVT